MKRIFCLTLTFLMLLSLTLTASVSALSPTYSVSFDSVEAMYASLKVYAESFPAVEGYYTGDLSIVPYLHHIENRTVIDPLIEGYDVIGCGYGETSYGGGVDYTSYHFENRNDKSKINMQVYYYQPKGSVFDETGWLVQEDAVYRSGVISSPDEFEYSAGTYPYDDTMITVYRICKGDLVMLMKTMEGFSDEDLSLLTFVERDMTFPVFIRDNKEFVTGDANCDGVLNIRDATEIQKYLTDVIMLDESALKKADYNIDGAVNVKDVTAIQKFLAGF